MTQLLAAHKRLLTRAKVAHLYRQKPYEAHKDDRLVLVLEIQSAEPERRARYCLEEGAIDDCFAKLMFECRRDVKYNSNHDYVIPDAKVTRRQIRTAQCRWYHNPRYIVLQSIWDVADGRTRNTTCT